MLPFIFLFVAISNCAAALHGDQTLFSIFKHQSRVITQHYGFFFLQNHGKTTRTSPKTKAPATEI